MLSDIERKKVKIRSSVSVAENLHEGNQKFDSTSFYKW